MIRKAFLTKEIHEKAAAGTAVFFFIGPPGSFAAAQISLVGWICSLYNYLRDSISQCEMPPPL